MPPKTYMWGVFGGELVEAGVGGRGVGGEEAGPKPSVETFGGSIAFPSVSCYQIYYPGLTGMRCLWEMDSSHVSDPGHLGPSLNPHGLQGFPEATEPQGNSSSCCAWWMSTLVVGDKYSVSHVPLGHSGHGWSGSWFSLGRGKKPGRGRRLCAPCLGGAAHSVLGTWYRSSCGAEGSMLLWPAEARAGDGAQP